MAERKGNRAFPEPRDLNKPYSEDLPKHFINSSEIFRQEMPRSDSPLRQFEGQYVAIVDGVIIKASPNFSELSREIRGVQGHYGPILMHEVDSTKYETVRGGRIKITE